MSGTAGSVPRWPVIAGLTVTGALAGVGSYAGGHGFAQVTGWGAWSPFLPLGTDVFAATAIYVWVTVLVSDVQRLARWCAVTAAVTSAAASGAYGLLTAGTTHVDAPWPVVVAGRVVPSGFLFLACHLAARLAVLRTETSSVSLQVEGGTELPENPAPPVQPVPVPVEVSPPPPGTGAGPDEVELLDRFLASGRKPTVTNVQDELGVSRRRALKLNREFQAVIGSSNGHGG